jgi:hypothetical protein
LLIFLSAGKHHQQAENQKTYGRVDAEFVAEPHNDDVRKEHNRHNSEECADYETEVIEAFGHSHGLKE